MLKYFLHWLPTYFSSINIQSSVYTPIHIEPDWFQADSPLVMHICECVPYKIYQQIQQIGPSSLIKI